MTTTRKSYGSALNSERDLTAKDRRLYGSSAYTMHKRRPTHGSSGECSISTNRSRSTIVVPESICVHTVELVYQLGAGNGDDSFET